MGIRIGYLTDTHLRNDLKGESPVEIRRCRQMATMLPLALAEIRRKKADIIVCTGDLVDEGDKAGTTADLNLCKTIFDSQDTPYLILPGNHDPEPELFYNVFPKPPKVTRINDCRLISFHEDFCLLNSSVSKRSEESLEEMKELLVQDQSVPVINILFQHYIIYPNHNEHYPYNYQNDEAIRALLENSTHKTLSISGHYHKGIPLVTKNGVSYFAGRAFCEAPHTAYMINVCDDETEIEELVIR